MSFIENDVLKEFNRISREITEVYYNISSNLGISDSTFIILYALVELGDGCRQADIVKAYCVNKQTINSSVKKLQKEGHIELRASKGLDRNIYITQKGKKLIEEKIYPIFELENSVINEFSKEEQIMLALLTKKYLEKLKEKSEYEQQKQQSLEELIKYKNNLPSIYRKHIISEINIMKWLNFKK